MRRATPSPGSNHFWAEGSHEGDCFESAPAQCWGMSLLVMWGLFCSPYLGGIFYFTQFTALGLDSFTVLVRGMALSLL